MPKARTGSRKTAAKLANQRRGSCSPCLTPRRMISSDFHASEADLFIPMADSPQADLDAFSRAFPLPYRISFTIILGRIVDLLMKCSVLLTVERHLGMGP